MAVVFVVMFVVFVAMLVVLVATFAAFVAPDVPAYAEFPVVPNVRRDAVPAAASEARFSFDSAIAADALTSPSTIEVAKFNFEYAIAADADTDAFTTDRAVGVRVSVNRASFPAAAVVAVVPKERRVGVPAAPSDANASFDSPIAAELDTFASTITEAPKDGFGYVPVNWPPAVPVGDDATAVHTSSSRRNLVPSGVPVGVTVANDPKPVMSPTATANNVFTCAAVSSNGTPVDPVLLPRMRAVAIVASFDRGRAVIVGFGYVPDRSPPADPDGAPPDPPAAGAGSNRMVMRGPVGTRAQSQTRMR